MDDSLGEDVSIIVFVINVLIIICLVVPLSKISYPLLITSHLTYNEK